jgi:hypothetical protein
MKDHHIHCSNMILNGAQRRRETTVAAVVGVDESNIQLWQKHKVVISECEAA